MPANVGYELDAAVVAEAADLAARSLALERRAALTFAEARRDALTGLPNRRAFDEHLDALIETADVALVLLDIDNFKQVNDTLGHAAGDEVLSTLARVLLRSVRANEQVFRLGGDEFAVVIADEHGRRGARRRADPPRRPAAPARPRAADALGRARPRARGHRHEEGSLRPRRRRSLRRQGRRARPAGRRGRKDAGAGARVCPPEGDGSRAGAGRPAPPAPHRRRRPRPLDAAADDLRDHRPRRRRGAERGGGRSSDPRAAPGRDRPRRVDAGDERARLLPRRSRPTPTAGRSRS